MGKTGARAHSLGRGRLSSCREVFSGSRPFSGCRLLPAAAVAAAPSRLAHGRSAVRVRRWAAPARPRLPIGEGGCGAWSLELEVVTEAVEPEVRLALAYEL